MKNPAVIQGTPQALAETPLGLSQPINSFLKRFVLLNKEVYDEAPMHLAVHLIDGLAATPTPYVHAHSHPSCDEIGLVIGQPGALQYEILLGKDIHKVSSPACIFIPAGTIHRARALWGNGAYVCMLMDPLGPQPSSVNTIGS
jgi:hypothetical protein